MNSWVLDCSAMAAVLLLEEDGKRVDALLDKAVTGEVEIVVPSLFWFEITNVVMMAERHQRLEKGGSDRLLNLLAALPIRSDEFPARAVVPRLCRIAAEHKLTAYDAAYLELAERVGARLKTFDKGLLRLARHFPWIE